MRTVVVAGALPHVKKLGQRKRIQRDGINSFVVTIKSTCMYSQITRSLKISTLLRLQNSFDVKKQPHLVFQAPRTSFPRARTRDLSTFEPTVGTYLSIEGAKMPS